MSMAITHGSIMGALGDSHLAQSPEEKGDNEYCHQHHHRGSTSTVASESTTDSSPTTTLSSITTEPSPGSSPDSPATAKAAPTSSSHHLHPSTTSDHSLPLMTSPPPSPFSPLSPGTKKARNTKNLSLNVKAATTTSVTSTMTAAGQPGRPLQIKTAIAATSESAPPSPSSTTTSSFVLPPKPQRKRPSQLGLTIQTPSCASLRDRRLNGVKGADHVPPTPGTGVRPPMLLRHHASSPALTLVDHGRGDEDGRPHRRRRSPSDDVPPSPHKSQTTDPISPILEQQSPIASPVQQCAFSPFPGSTQTSRRPSRIDTEGTISPRTTETGGDDDDGPRSNEVASPAYPDGPVRIYDSPNVWLYLEPTRQQAKDFDVIFNVAREVPNPLPETDTIPEYIHIPWDHNTSIVDDLPSLVEQIDSRVQKGQKILVHCQCGVSRSASLIVAYGLYRDPSLSVQEAYDAVKARSRWIGPNMSLIYQLSEFRNKLHSHQNMHPFRRRRGVNMPGTAHLSGRANTIAEGSPAARPLLALHGAEKDTSERPDEPQTAPLPTKSEGEENRLNLPVPPMGQVSPGPLSAPSGLTFVKDLAPSTPSAPAPLAPTSDRRLTAVYIPSDTSPRTARNASLPIRKLNHKASWTTPHGKQIGLIPPPNTVPPVPTVPALTQPLQPTLADGSNPPSPALFSPRAIEFTANPFEAAMTTSMGGSGPEEGVGPHDAVPVQSKRESKPAKAIFPDSDGSGPGRLEVDPRSPPHRGEVPIVRSILDVL